MANSYNPLNNLNELLNKIKSSTTIIDDIFVKKLLKDWNISDFGIDENGEVTNNYAIEKITKILDIIKSNVPNNINYILLLKNSAEINNAIMNKQFVTGLISLNLCMGIYNYYLSKIDKSDLYFKSLKKLTTSLNNNYQGLIISYLSNDALTVIQKTRMIYENYIISLFISKNKELAEPFLEHRNILLTKILKDIESILDDKLPDNINIIDKYGEDFKDNYGWTKSIIKEKENRNLGFMASELGFSDDLSFIYKLTSNIIHTNSFSISIDYKTGSILMNLCMPFITDILIKQTILYVNDIFPNSKEAKLLTIILNKLKDIV